MKEQIIKTICNLFKVKTLVTLALTVAMVMLVSGRWDCPTETLALFSTVYGAVITYFFTKKEDEKDGEIEDGGIR